MQGYVTTVNVTIDRKSRILVFVITARKTNKTTTAKMIRYYFNITINGIKLNVNVDANNRMTAYGKVKRLYPMATNIHLTRTERRWNQGML